MTDSPKHIFQRHLNRRNEATGTVIPMSQVFGEYKEGGWMDHGKAFGLFHKKDNLASQWSVMVIKYKDEEGKFLSVFYLTGDSRTFQTRTDARAYVKILRGSA